MTAGRALAIVPPPCARPSAQHWGYGRELFGAFRASVGSAEQGASVCFAANYSEPVVSAAHALTDATIDA